MLRRRLPLQTLLILTVITVCSGRCVGSVVAIGSPQWESLNHLSSINSQHQTPDNADQERPDEGDERSWRVPPGFMSESSDFAGGGNFGHSGQALFSFLLPSRDDQLVAAMAVCAKLNYQYEFIFELLRPPQVFPHQTRIA